MTSSPDPGSSPTRGLGAIGSVLVLGVGLTVLLFGIKLRIETLPYHQNLWGIDWLTYYEGQGRALRGGNPFLWLFSWEGLHPPLSGIVHGFIQTLGGGLPIHWAATTLAGLAGAVALALEGWRRTSALAFLLLLIVHSFSPLQVNYALNASPYPWALLLLGVSSVLLLRAADGGSSRVWLAAAIASALAAQAHVLAFAAVGVQGLFLLTVLGWRPSSWSPQLRRWVVFVALSAAFVIAVSLFKTRDPWTFHVGEEEPWVRTAWHVMSSRFGELAPRLPLVILLGVGALGGLLTDSRRTVLLLLAQAVAILAALAFFIEIHVADPRLTHYYLAPHLLLVGAGCIGLAALGRLGGRIGIGALALAFALCWWPAATTSFAWHEARDVGAGEAMQGETIEAIQRMYRDAGEGDILAYLWDHRFLNDEPEHLDPIAASFPTSRLGRPCFHIESPRMQCSRSGGTLFYFDPKSFNSEFEPLEETLRLIINSAAPPGRARLIVVPGEEVPVRPWPVEPWFEEHGGELEVLQDPGVLVWTFPSGLVIPSPPPMVPPAPPSEEDEPPASDP